MDKHNLFSILQFGYPPLSAYEFEHLLNDIDIQNTLKNSVLYIIARRPLIQFDDYILNKDERTISFNLSRSDLKT